jgi:hypothetical protein
VLKAAVATGSASALSSYFAQFGESLPGNVNHPQPEALSPFD